jgi:hypothetical protein
MDELYPEDYWTRDSTSLSIFDELDLTTSYETLLQEAPLPSEPQIFSGGAPRGRGRPKGSLSTSKMSEEERRNKHRESQKIYKEKKKVSSSQAEKHCKKSISEFSEENQHSFFYVCGDQPLFFFGLCTCILGAVGYSSAAGTAKCCT